MTPSVKIPFNARNHTGPTKPRDLIGFVGITDMKPKDKALIVSLIQEGFTG
jgi:hypothetical protein